MPVAEGLPAVDPATKNRPGGRAIAASLGLALLGFVATAGILHAAIGSPLYLHADKRSEKLYLLHQWRGKVFSASFGTSHIHNGFDPAVFDATLAGTPAATHSANLAVEGGAQSEQFVMAREFLRNLEAPSQAGAPPQPCTVVLELSAGTNFVLAHLVHPRAINIYDWPVAHLITHYVSSQMTPSQRLGRSGFALVAMGLHYLNVGMLSNAVFAPPLDQESIQQQAADGRRGQIALPFHAAYMPVLDQLLRQMPPVPVQKEGMLVPGNSEIVELLARVAPDKNVSFVYLYMPTVETKGTSENFPDHLTVAGPHGPLAVPIVNLARPDLYPDLYNPRIWYDGDHVDGEGATLVTRTFAAQLARWYAAHGWPPACG